MASNPCMHSSLKGSWHLPAYCGKESTYVERLEDGRIIATYCTRHRTQDATRLMPTQKAGV